MPVSQTSFGYYPYALDCEGGDIRISTLDTFEETVNEISQDPFVHEGWFYPGPQIVRRLGQENTERPYPARLFSLPRTHVLRHTSSVSETHTDFLIWGFGFCKGLHVSSHPHAFLDAAPLKPGTLTDFILADTGLETALPLIDQFWLDHQTDKRASKRVIAVIHALYLAGRPHLLDYEEFNLLYMALDSLAKLTQTLRPSSQGHIPHSRRIEAMCNTYGLPTPDWARANPGGSEISIIRNDTLHEALFFGEPLGYAVYDHHTREQQYRNVLLEMNALICRLLVAILFGTQNSYVQSPVGTRQRYRLEI